MKICHFLKITSFSSTIVEEMHLFFNKHADNYLDFLSFWLDRAVQI